MKAIRGFSLVEILVALTLGVMVMGITLGVLQRTYVGTARDRARSTLAREAQFVHLTLQRSLMSMGTGVPRGSRIDTTDNTEIPTSVLVGHAKGIGILGDLVRPHAQYNTFGWLHTQAGGDERHIAWHTENNGACMPGADMETSGGGACAPQDYSTFFPGDGAGKCNARGDEGHRLCPWGVRRLEQGDHFQISAGNGAWTWAEFDFDGNGIDTVGGTAFMELDAPYSDTAAEWPNNAPNSLPVSAPGPGFVTTLDRIFFEIVGKRLVRTQCWGDPDISSANWPPLADTTSLPSGLSLANAQNFDGSNHECTPGETLTSSVVDASSSFSYFDADNVATTAKDAIRRVDYYILLRSPPTPFGDVLEFPVVGSVGFRNIGMATASTTSSVGLDSGPPPSGDG